jgi:sugar phosphate isomerase/epimerase
MELSVSNIAWTNEEETAIAEKLQELGLKHVEIAPTKFWQDPTNISLAEAQAYADWWAGYGIKVSAFQSMLYTRPDLKIFDNCKNCEETSEYMRKFIELAGVMKSNRMVFGSPKNRQRGEMSVDMANNIAIDFFSKLGDIALKNNVILCIEPNAIQYNCDYITNTSEGIELVKGVNSPGIGLHLDIACMSLAGEDVADSICRSKDILEHFHVSSPMLDQVEARPDVDHVAAAKALRCIGYDKLISIEMRPGNPGTNVDRVEKAIKFVRETYLDY